MNFLNEHFKIIALSLNAAILLLVLSIKMSTCTLANDMRTTKKTTKSLNEKSLTADELDKRLNRQTETYLSKEKQLDGIKDTTLINQILKDSVNKK